MSTMEEDKAQAEREIEKIGEQLIGSDKRYLLALIRNYGISNQLIGFKEGTEAAGKIYRENK